MVTVRTRLNKVEASPAVINLDNSPSKWGTIKLQWCPNSRVQLALTLPEDSINLKVDFPTKVFNNISKTFRNSSGIQDTSSSNNSTCNISRCFSNSNLSNRIWAANNTKTTAIWLITITWVMLAIIAWTLTQINPLRSCLWTITIIRRDMRADPALWTTMAATPCLSTYPTCSQVTLNSHNNSFTLSINFNKWGPALITTHLWTWVEAHKATISMITWWIWIINKWLWICTSKVTRSSLAHHIWDLAEAQIGFLFIGKWALTISPSRILSHSSTTRAQCHLHRGAVKWMTTSRWCYHSNRRVTRTSLAQSRQSVTTAAVGQEDTTVKIAATVWKAWWVGDTQCLNLIRQCLRSSSNHLCCKINNSRISLSTLSNLFLRAPKQTILINTCRIINIHNKIMKIA